MLGDVVAAEGEGVLVVFPVALDQFDIESFILEISVLDRAENGCFTGQADVADADFVGLRLVRHAFFFAAAGEDQRGSAAAVISLLGFIGSHCRSLWMSKIEWARLRPNASGMVRNKTESGDKRS